MSIENFPLNAARKQIGPKTVVVWFESGDKKNIVSAKLLKNQEFFRLLKGWSFYYVKCSKNFEPFSLSVLK